MMACSYNTLKDKEVISVTDGRRLGYIIDVEIDIFSGKIVAIVLPPPGKLFSLFSSKDNCKIPWDCIERIGGDIILVKSIDAICGRKGNPHDR
jgi:YlmC/YmxH family sporulation protein